MNPFTERTPEVRDILLEARFRELELKLNKGLPLSPLELVLYSVKVRNQADSLKEPAVDSSEGIGRSLYTEWRSLVEDYKGSGFGYGVVTQLRGWEDLENRYGGWGAGNKFGLIAVDYIQDRVREIEQYENVGIVLEDTLRIRGLHIESLNATANVINNPERLSMGSNN